MVRQSAERGQARPPGECRAWTGGASGRALRRSGTWRFGEMPAKESAGYLAVSTQVGNQRRYFATKEASTGWPESTG